MKENIYSMLASKTKMNQSADQSTIIFFTATYILIIASQTELVKLLFKSNAREKSILGYATINPASLVK